MALFGKTKERCKKIGKHIYGCKRKSGKKKGGAKAKWDKERNEPVVVDEYGNDADVKKKTRKRVKEYARQNEIGAKKNKEFAEL